MLLVVAGHTAPAIAQQQWRTIEPAGAGFRIEFPANPKTEWKDLPSEFGTTRTLVSLLSHDDGLDFLMMYSKFSDGSFSRGPRVELDMLRDSSIRAVQGRLLSETALSVSGVPARRVVIAFHGGDRIATVLFVLRGTRLYQAMCIVPRSRENVPDISHFVDSLVLVPF
jgi:hypothetical protein